MLARPKERQKSGPPRRGTGGDRAAPWPPRAHVIGRRSTKSPTVVTNGGSADAILCASPATTTRGEPGHSTKPIASAPARTAASASSTLVMPQILTRVRGMANYASMVRGLVIPVRARPPEAHCAPPRGAATTGSVGAHHSSSAIARESRSSLPSYSAPVRASCANVGAAPCGTARESSRSSRGSARADYPSARRCCGSCGVGTIGAEFEANIRRCRDGASTACASATRWHSAAREAKSRACRPARCVLLLARHELRWYQPPPCGERRATSRVPGIGLWRRTASKRALNSPPPDAPEQPTSSAGSNDATHPAVSGRAARLRNEPPSSSRHADRCGLPRPCGPAHPRSPRVPARARPARRGRPAAIASR